MRSLQYLGIILAFLSSPAMSREGSYSGGYYDIEYVQKQYGLVAIMAEKLAISDLVGEKELHTKFINEVHEVKGKNSEECNSKASDRQCTVIDLMYHSILNTYKSINEDI